MHPTSYILHPTSHILHPTSSPATDGSRGRAWVRQLQIADLSNQLDACQGPLDATRSRFAIATSLVESLAHQRKEWSATINMLGERFERTHVARRTHPPPAALGRPRKCLPRAEARGRDAREGRNKLQKRGGSPNEAYPALGSSEM